VSLPLALDIRAAVTADGLGLGTFIDIVQPIIEARRLEARDDLISVLVHSEVQDEAGEVHVLSDDEILGFAFLLLAAGSGTTWKQMGIALTALLSHPDWLLAAKEDPAVLRASIEESLRWTPTDPMFARFATRDTTLGGFDVPAGSPIHLCFGAANRDPLRWDRPDEFDPGRPMQAHLGFGGGPHICLGMHVARAEMQTAIAALLARLPNLRPDPDAETPRIIGMYERGPTSVPVVFG
jgi:cytochrome P450